MRRRLFLSLLVGTLLSTVLLVIWNRKFVSVFSFRELTIQKMNDLESLCMQLDYLKIDYNYDIADIYRVASGSKLTDEALQYYKYDAWGNEMKVIDLATCDAQDRIIAIVSLGGPIDEFIAKKTAICKPMKRLKNE